PRRGGWGENVGARDAALAVGAAYPRRERMQLGAGLDRLGDERLLVELVCERGLELGRRRRKLALRGAMQQQIDAFDNDAPLCGELALAMREHALLGFGGEHV